MRNTTNMSLISVLEIPAQKEFMFPNIVHETKQRSMEFNGNSILQGKKNYQANEKGLVRVYLQEKFNLIIRKNYCLLFMVQVNQIN